MRIHAQPSVALAFLLLIICIVLSQSSGEEIPTLPYDYVLSPHKKRLPIESWQKNRVFSGSDAAPMAKWLQTSSFARTATFEVLKFFKRKERQMARATKMSTASNATLQQKARVCNVKPSIANYNGARFSSSLNGYGVLPSEKCVTEFTDDGTDKHFYHFKSFISELNDVAKNVSNSVFGNWTHADTPGKFEYRTNYQKCKMYRAVGYRIDGFWAVVGVITNANVNAQLADWKRHYIVEHIVRRPDGKLDAFPGYMRDHKTNKLVKSTTPYARWGFRPTPSFFGSSSPEKNPAIAAAIDRSERLKQQAEDTTTPSNTLILMLPLWMAVVPIALFSDVSRVVAIGYSVATDIMSAMPLAIKGIELLQFAAGRHLATRTFIFGMRDADSFAIAESWAAECTVVSSMHSRGLIYLAVALVSMILGTALEVFTWRRVQRKKKLTLEKQSECMARSPLEYIWMREIPCERCTCYEHVVNMAQVSAHASDITPRWSTRDFSGGLLSYIRRKRKS